MKDASDFAVATAMQRFGGGFAQALAMAMLRADAENLAKLRAAFPELWEEYGQLAVQEKLGGAGR